MLPIDELNIPLLQTQLWGSVAIISAAILSMIICKRLVFRIKGRVRPLFRALMTALLGPTLVGILTIALFSIHLLFFKQDSWISNVLVGTLLQIIVILLSTWFILRFIGCRGRQYLNKEVDSPIDHTTVIAISKLSRLGLFFVSAIILLEVLHMPLTGIVAFGGVSGAVIAFAAKDMFDNFFGGLMVHLDRPFSVGDWIHSPNQKLEGIVEYIGWRVTRIRDFQQYPIYVPNAVFSRIVLNNPARMTHRRIYETLSVRYSDFTLLTQLLKKIKQYIQSHPQIDTNKTLMVNFNHYATSSINFFIYCFVIETDWMLFHNIKEEILLKVGELILEEGAGFAFPTSTIHLMEQSKAQDQSLPFPQEPEDNSPRFSQ